MRDHIATAIFWTLMVAAAGLVLWIRFRDGFFLYDSDLLEKFLKVGLPSALSIALVFFIVVKLLNRR